MKAILIIGFLTMTTPDGTSETYKKVFENMEVCKVETLAIIEHMSAKFPALTFEGECVEQRDA